MTEQSTKNPSQPQQVLAQVGPIYGSNIGSPFPSPGQVLL